MAAQPTCPSCRHRLSNLAIECPVCGIPVARQPQKRPLLFQVSKSRPQHHSQPDANNAPSAGGQLTATAAAHGAQPSPALPAGFEGKLKKDPLPGATSHGIEAAGSNEGHGIFWRLALMEFQEAVALLLLNGMIVFVVCWQLKLPMGQAYSYFWPYFLALHFLASWAYFMLPMVLTGSTLAMLRLGFGIADYQPEKRLSFSIFMLTSVALMPLSFLCMVLTPAHATLAELLTGQEIRERTPDLLKR